MDVSHTKALTEKLADALQAAARKEILRNPSSAAQFATQTKANQAAVITAYSAWVLPVILPIINEHLEDHGQQAIDEWRSDQR